MFEFAFIWAWLFFPLPWLMRFVPKETQSLANAIAVPFYKQLDNSLYKSQSRHKPYKYLWWLLWFFLILALSGPQWVGEAQPIKRTGRNIMLALDISGSMQMDDMRLEGNQVSRLTVVKKTALDFIKHRVGDRLGLILFGTKPYLQTPLTFDRKTVEHMLLDATVGLAGQTTSVGDAIGLATKQLDKVPAKSRVLILLTDGANNSGVLEPIQAANIAKSHDIKIYTIGLGAERIMVQGFLGLQAINPSSDLDEASLKKIASLTGGEFFRARNFKQLQNVYKTIDALEPVAQDSKPYRPISPYYYYPLLIALLLYFLLAYMQFFIRFGFQSKFAPWSSRLKKNGGGDE